MTFQLDLLMGLKSTTDLITVELLYTMMFSFKCRKICQKLKKIQRQPKCPLIDDWRKKIWYIQGESKVGL